MSTFVLALLAIPTLACGLLMVALTADDKSAPKAPAKAAPKAAAKTAAKKADTDPGRILVRRPTPAAPLNQEVNFDLAGWLAGAEHFDNLYGDRRGITVWGHRNLRRTRLHHPIMWWDLVEKTTAVERNRMVAWFAKGNR
jgi:hypothetical protein